MSYNDEIEKVEQEQIVELYEINVGGVISFFTSADFEIIFQSNIYSPRRINRQEITYSDENFGNNVDVFTSIDSTLSRHISQAPPDELDIKVTRLFQTGDDNDSIAIFNGKMVGISFTEDTAKTTFSSSNNLFEATIPPHKYSSFCNHVLFDSGCGLNEGDFEDLAIVNVINSTLISSAFATQTDGYYTGGHCKTSDESDVRMITNHVGDTITLQIPFLQSQVTSGSQVKVYPGCDLSGATCKNTYNNLENFFAHTTIPSENPVLFGF